MVRLRFIFVVVVVVVYIVDLYYDMHGKLRNTEQNDRKKKRFCSGVRNVVFQVGNLLNQNEFDCILI